MSPRINHEPRVEPVATPIGEAWIEAGILWHRLDTETAVDIQKATETVVALAGIVGDQRLPAVVDIRGVHFADRQARKVFSEEVDFELATALVVDSRLSEALGNAYLMLTRPRRPTKLFTDVNHARAWAFDFVPSP